MEWHLRGGHDKRRAVCSHHPWTVCFSFVLGFLFGLDFFGFLVLFLFSCAVRSSWNQVKMWNLSFLGKKNQTKTFPVSWVMGSWYQSKLACTGLVMSILPCCCRWCLPAMKMWGGQFEPAQELHPGLLSHPISWTARGAGLGADLVSQTSKNHPNSGLAIQRENKHELEELPSAAMSEREGL